MISCIVHSGVDVVVVVVVIRLIPRSGGMAKTIEPQKPGNSPGSKSEVVKRQRVAERRKESAVGQCRMR